MLLFALACKTSSPNPADDCDCPAAEDTAPATDTDTTKPADTAPPGDTGDTGDTGEAPKALPTQVYLLGGQSNMDGYGYATGLPPSLQLAQDDVQIYWSGRPVWSGLMPSSYSTAYFGAEFFGPEVTFGRALADARPDADVVLIKHAIGGTDLAVCWSPGEDASDPTKGTCYTGWLATVNDALAALSGDYEIAGMVWMQGESDATVESWASAYEDNLTHLIDRVREDVGASEMPFAMGLIDCSVHCTWRDTVRAAQQSVADSSDLVFTVETADLPQNLDSLHFDASGVRTLGTRLADALLGETVQTPTAQPAFALTGSALSYYTGDYIVGYQFETADWITLTDLGTLDYGYDGLSDGSTVVLWDAADLSILARATVDAAITSPSSIWGGWRFVGIEPLDLPPGEYIIGSQVYSGSADRYLHNAEAAAAEGITWQEGRHANGVGIQYPTNVSTGETSWFGPNFLFLPVD